MDTHRDPTASSSIPGCSAAAAPAPATVSRPRIFISYSSKDLDTANTVRAYLASEGMDGWMARYDIPGGADWGEAIVDAISASAAVVLVYSTHANASRQVRRELAVAFEVGVPVTALRTDDTQVSPSILYYTGRIGWLSPEADGPEKQLIALRDALRDRMGAGRRANLADERSTADASWTRESARQARLRRWFQNAASLALAIAALRITLELILLFNPDDDLETREAVEYWLLFQPVHTAVAGVAAAAFVAWFAEAHARLVTMGLAPLAFQRRSIAAAFFVPFRSVVTGLYALQEIWRASDPNVATASNGRWQMGRVHLASFVWWPCATAAAMIALHLGVAVAQADDLRPIALEMLVGTGCGATVAVGAKAFVRAVDRRQRDLERVMSTRSRSVHDSAS